jgi:hypothetical protein
MYPINISIQMDQAIVQTDLQLVKKISHILRIFKVYYSNFNNTLLALILSQVTSVQTLLSDFITTQIQIIFPFPPIYYARPSYSCLRSKPFIHRFSLLWVPTASSHHINFVFITQKVFAEN